ncbi:hypothetical protein LSH36_108g01106 [Paralvinella palmiformis]|uniref:tRNA pseudouridine(55) synthase n=1 Tax=Paralvinella palmiformis TaxID=53620 RepID=A0AAD9K007_9ANNE|nr:hypothetical protein LSH36_108g01106 [Paralvinella palmiformis]
MDEMQTYQSALLMEDQDVSEAIKLMHSWCVCPRCILRFLCIKAQELYKQSTKELEIWLYRHMKSDADVSGFGNREKKGADFVCIACIGILQDGCCSETFCHELFDTVQKEGFQFDSYYMSLSIPVPLILREYSVFLKLRELIPNVAKDSSKEEVAQIKEAWKWACGPFMSKLLGVPFDQKSLFQVKLTFDHPELERECHFLYDLYPDVFCRRKNNKHGWEVFTRVNVPNALEDMGPTKFQKNYCCPPRALSMTCQCTSVICTHEAIFIAGRYNKYSRDLSQTPWVVDGERRTESSIEEMICAHLQKATQAKEYKLSASGREDVDVLMLGRGRPFVIEMINPRKIRFTAQEMKEIQDSINKSHKEIRVRDLQIVTKEDTGNLKKGEEEKVKRYSAMCWANKVLSQELLDSRLNHLENLIIQQKTPIRVLHRRALAIRERAIHKISAKLKDDHHFVIFLSTQAGTYIKEFVHGDFGRTVPNLGRILDAECDILELSVEAVELDWPHQLEEYNSEDEVNPYDLLLT